MLLIENWNSFSVNWNSLWLLTQQKVWQQCLLEIHGLSLEHLLTIAVNNILSILVFLIWISTIQVRQVIELLSCFAIIVIRVVEGSSLPSLSNRSGFWERSCESIVKLEINRHHWILTDVNVNGILDITPEF